MYSLNSPTGNVFSNETALMKLSDGSSMRINEYRRIGHPGVERMCLYGTEACFEQNMIGAAWLTKTEKIDITADLACPNGTFAKVHDAARLPTEFAGKPNGHWGSHQFLVDDFVTACVDRTLPPVNVWAAASYVLPGLVAHESAMTGKVLPVPYLGDAPGPSVTRS